MRVPTRCPCGAQIVHYYGHLPELAEYRYRCRDEHIVAVPEPREIRIVGQVGTEPARTRGVNMPGSISDLLDGYDRATAYHSLPGPMADTPAFAALVAEGDAAIGAILRRFRDGGRAGMNLVLVLETITGERPLEPEPVTPGFVAWDVPAILAAWVRWGEARGYLESAGEDG